MLQLKIRQAEAGGTTRVVERTGGKHRGLLRPPPPAGRLGPSPSHAARSHIVVSRPCKTRRLSTLLLGMATEGRCATRVSRTHQAACPRSLVPGRAANRRTGWRWCQRHRSAPVSSGPAGSPGSCRPRRTGPGPGRTSPTRGSAAAGCRTARLARLCPPAYRSARPSGSRTAAPRTSQACAKETRISRAVGLKSHAALRAVVRCSIRRVAQQLAGGAKFRKR